jgi:uncharacterized protein (DUF2062 family)
LPTKPTNEFPDHRPLVVIPAYNHPDTLRDVAERALALHPDVLVVDDGSDRDCAGLVAGLPVRLVRHEKNRGKGAAILTGAAEALRGGFTHVVTLDADGQHHPEELPRFFEAIRRDPDAIVVGCRDFSAENVPRSSVFGRSFSNFWLRVQTGKSVADVQSGYRAYPLAVLEGLDLGEKRFSFEVEVLVKSAWAGVELRDLDIPVTYQKAGERISHFDKLRDNLRLSLLNTRLTIRSILPWHTRRLVKDASGRSRISALRPMHSLQLLLAENTTPRDLAEAGALGMFIGALPLVAVQTITVLAVAGYLRMNRMVALAVNQLCTPPFVPALCIEVGYFLRNGKFLTEFTLQTLGYQALSRIADWAVGSLVLAPILAVSTGGAILLLAKAAQRKGPRGA